MNVWPSTVTVWVSPVLATVHILPVRRPAHQGGGPRVFLLVSAGPGVYWGHAIDLEGRHHLRSGQRAGQGLQRDRGPRRLPAPGARRGRRADPLPAAVRGLRQGRRLRAHRQGVRGRRHDRRAHRRRPQVAARGAQPRDRGGRVRADATRSTRSCFDRSYFLEPDGGAVEGVRRCCVETLEETDRTAIVQFSLRQKTRLGALRVARQGADAAVAAVGRRGARGRLFGAGRRPRSVSQQGAEHGRLARRQHGDRLRAGPVQRRLPGAAADADRRQARARATPSTPPPRSARSRRRRRTTPT